jgi:hypothetical protein
MKKIWITLILIVGLTVLWIFTPGLDKESEIDKNQVDQFKKRDWKIMAP